MRLTEFIDKYSLIEPNQYGFRKGKSTKDAIINLTDLIHNSSNDKYFALSVFIDFSKAFESINHKFLLAKLEKYGIRSIQSQLLSSFLLDRQHRTKIEKYIFIF